METEAKPVIDITGVKEPAYFLAEERTLDGLEEEVAWLMEDEGWLPTGGPFSAYDPKWRETFWHQALYRPAGDANTRRFAETSRPELYTGVKNEKDTDPTRNCNGPDPGSVFAGRAEG